nr:MAG TPA: hypothetical protein [Caudoviricetes sp.]
MVVLLLIPPLSITLQPASLYSPNTTKTFSYNYVSIL